MSEQEPRYAELEALCPQPCVHLSAEDSREGKECPEHPCICSQREISDAMVDRAGRALGMETGLEQWIDRTSVRAALKAALRVPVECETR